MYCTVCEQDWLALKWNFCFKANISIKSVDVLLLGQASFFMMSRYVLVLFWRSSEPFLAVLTTVRIVFRMNGNNMPFKAWGICSAIFTVLTLIHFPATVCLHMLFKLILLPKSLFASLTPKWKIFSVNWENMAT